MESIYNNDISGLIAIFILLRGMLPFRRRIEFDYFSTKKIQEENVFYETTFLMLNIRDKTIYPNEIQGKILLHFNDEITIAEVRKICDIQRSDNFEINENQNKLVFCFNTFLAEKEGFIIKLHSKNKIKNNQIKIEKQGFKNKIKRNKTFFSKNEILFLKIKGTITTILILFIMVATRIKTFKETEETFKNIYLSNSFLFILMFAAANVGYYYLLIDSKKKINFIAN